MFYEIVVAPSYTEKGLEILKGKSKTLRILKAEHTKKGRRSLRQIGGGWLLQDSDDKTPEDLGFRVVTSKVPTLELVDDAQFAWLCCKHVKSNAIVVAKVCLHSLCPVPLLALYCYNEVLYYIFCLYFSQFDYVLTPLEFVIL